MKRKGSLLAMTLLVASAIFFFGLIFLSCYRSEKNLVQRAKEDLIALEAAGAGIQDAIYQLKRDPSWNTGFSSVSLPRSGGAYTVSFNSGQTDVPWSTNNSQGTTAVTGYGGRTVPPGLIHLVCTGRAGKSKKTEEMILKVGLNQSLFKMAAFLSNGIILNANTYIDSFDSSKGTYAQTVQQTGANVGSNQSAAGSVSLNASAYVYGNISVGPGGSLSTISGSSTSYLSYSVAPAQQDFPFRTPPTGANLGNISVSGGTITLPPGVYGSLTASGSAIIQLQGGNYVFTGNISTSGSSQLVVPASGRTSFYTNGTIAMSGTSPIYNPSLRPENFVIYGGAGTTSVQLTNTGDNYFALYAPAADVSLRNKGNIFGAVIARSLSMSTGQTAIHYDRSLQFSGVGSGGSSSGGGSGSGSGGGVTVFSRW